MTWAEGGEKIVIKLTIDEAIGVVTRLYKLRLIFDYINVIDDTSLRIKYREYLYFRSKDYFSFFFF